MEPSFFLSYWRPWDENSSFIDCWGNYLRDTSLVNSGVDKIGSYIQHASFENVRAIEESSQKQVQATVAAGMMQVKAIQQAAEMIGFKLDKVADNLSFLNRRMDIVLEQQRLNQLSLEELLRVPDSEKERLNRIKNGVHFFTASSKNPELLEDALEEFMKALEMKKQDYFVLHKVGCIYLFSQKYLDPEKALDYFLRAGKYASVDCDFNTSTGDCGLKGNFNYVDSSSDVNQIQLLSADIYEKAALSSYVLGSDTKAVQYQELAVKYCQSGKMLFNLAKYLFRVGDLRKALDELELAIDIDPDMLNAVFCDVDVASSPEVPEMINRKWAELSNDIEKAIETNSSANESLSLASLKKRIIKTAHDSLFKEKQYSKARRLMSFYSLEDAKLEKIAQMQDEILEARLVIWRENKASREDHDALMRIIGPTLIPFFKSFEDFYANHVKALALLKSFKSKS